VSFERELKRLDISTPATTIMMIKAMDAAKANGFLRHDVLINEFLRIAFCSGVLTMCSDTAAPSQTYRLKIF
jgi:hypothetical protein